MSLVLNLTYIRPTSLLRLIFQDACIAKAFNVCLDVPPVRGPSEIAAVLRDHSTDRYVFPTSEVDKVTSWSFHALHSQSNVLSFL